MDNTLTKKQRQILGYITMSNNAGFGPTLREIAAAVNCNAHSTIFYHIKELEKKGYVNKSPLEKGGIMALKRPEPENIVPLIKRNIEEDWLFDPKNIFDYFNFSPGILGLDPKDKIFLFRAWDNSMVKSGIEEKDLCLFIENNYPMDKNIVLAKIKMEDSNTNTLIIRRLIKDRLSTWKWILRPDSLEKEKFRAIEITGIDSLRVIVGTLKGVLKTF
ncbi:MAG: hypothetical protein FJW69_09860 [Actinobacteria bacterium]|nr:hypothetical protein [Actinomycetota bacterium]MBM3713997.1 hypothetical protein [Actinomycetota bacterium]